MQTWELKKGIEKMTKTNTTIKAYPFSVYRSHARLMVGTFDSRGGCAPLVSHA